MTLAVSVVVPTYQRPYLLRRCLRALLAQAFDPAAYEIIVADDAASTATRQLVQSFATKKGEQAERPCLRYLPNPGPHHGPAAARNCGWQAANAPIIAFTDDDCIPHPDWLRCALAAFTPEIVGVSGRVIVPLPEEPTDYERDAAGIQGMQFLTANCFYRRPALTAVGGFDEEFALAWREDSDLFFALLQHYDGDERFVHAPDAVVLHPIRPARWGVSVWQQRRSLYNALLYKKYPALYRALIQSSPPWPYYQTVAALALALLGVAVHALWLVVLAGLAWVWFTGRFCLHRLRDVSHAPAHVAEMVVTSAVIPPLSVFWRLAGAVKYRVLFL